MKRNWENSFRRHFALSIPYRDMTDVLDDSTSHGRERRRGNTIFLKIWKRPAWHSGIRVETQHDQVSLGTCCYMDATAMSNGWRRWFF